jgi:D-alanyl-D-alanine carboxypeptidase/D-alanyl-D-alanine-endopeptidase (penicillin-binding protein 4)
MTSLLALLILAADPSAAILKKRIDAVVERPAFASAFWGIEVRSLERGNVLYARNAGKDLKPASTLKLVTTAAALDAFGPDERLRTTLESAAALDAAGVLRGDVFLVGRGDPNLSGRFTEGKITAAFQALAGTLVASGVKRIEGRLVGHEGLFKGERRGDDWSWDDLVWWYGAEVSALSFNDNCADLSIRGGALPGEPVVVERNPVSDYYSVVSEATTSASGTKSDLTLRKAPGSNLIRLSGTFPAGAPAEELNVALEDPARYAATVFAEVLASQGISVAAVATSFDPLPAGLRVLAAHDGEPVSEMIKAVNKPSQNLHAEMLLRLLGARIKGEGSAEAGHQAVKAFLQRIGADSDRWALQDGSGLSRSDLLAPHDLVSLLVAMDAHRYAAVFRDSLPIAGVDGSLRHRLKGTPAEGRILAKTGGIRHVHALAGYVTPRHGARLAFAVILNSHTGAGSEAAAAIDEIALALVGR